VIQETANRIVRVLSSRLFWYGILVFFVLESLWVAVSSVYPMAFDEDFHLGLIKLYSHYWLPFLHQQPAGADALGAVARDPSYLYHYLFSFPYRVVALFTDSQTAQIIVLRLLNIGLFAVALVLFRRVLRVAGSSPALRNVSLAIFVLIPIVPLLAGQINYDNLVLPLMAWVCLLAHAALGQLKRREINYRTLGLLLSVSLLASLVTHIFLPIMVVVIGFVGGCALAAFWKHGKALRTALRAGFFGLSRWSKIGLMSLLVVSLGLFVQRDGVNVLSYGTPVPDCGQVLGVGRCDGYSPWARNELFAEQKNGSAMDRPLDYTTTWLMSLHFRSFFVVSGPNNQFANYPPLPLPSATAIVVLLSGVVALLLHWRQAFAGRRLLVLFLCISTVYAVALWLEDYSQYRYTGQPVAVNGRYLLVIVLPLAAIFGRALRLALQPVAGLKPWLTVAVLLLFLQGGGVLSYISRSDASWDWPTSWVVTMNDTARRMLAPVLIESGKQY